MRFLPDLFANNREWAARSTAVEPDFFARLSGLQAPRFLWIGCSDSRVPANEIVGLAPGELFVHRNVANVVPRADLNAMAVLQYAIDFLRVDHVIVCGHYGCGGVQAALGDPLPGPLEQWLEPLRAVARSHSEEIEALGTPEARWRRMCELNVAAQVRAVCSTPIVASAWQRGQSIVVHGWIYDIRDGLLRDLDLSVSGGDTRAPQPGR